MFNINLDHVHLNFAGDNFWLLNVLLGFIMFGVALEIKSEHFIQLLKHPKPALVGILSQVIITPALTFVLTLILKPSPSIALGMILVAACPGGNISNFISSLAKANVALAVSLTAFSTLMAFITTPLNFTIWASLNPATAPLLKEISISPFEMIKTVVLLLGIPLAIGIFISNKFPKFTAKIIKPIKISSIVIFAAFVLIAFSANIAIFLEYFFVILLLVFIHNSMALGIGFFTAKTFRLAKQDTRTLTIETGIHNSGLGLVLIFAFFNGLGGMAVIAAWWGIWHIISGLAIATYWSRKPLTQN